MPSRPAVAVLHHACIPRTQHLSPLALVAYVVRDRHVICAYTARMPVESKQLRFRRTYIGKTLCVPRQYYVSYHGVFIYDSNYMCADGEAVRHTNM